MFSIWKELRANLDHWFVKKSVLCLQVFDIFVNNYDYSTENCIFQANGWKIQKLGVARWRQPGTI